MSKTRLKSSASDTEEGKTGFGKAKSNFLGLIKRNSEKKKKEGSSQSRDEGMDTFVSRTEDDSIVSSSIQEEKPEESSSVVDPEASPSTHHSKSRTHRSTKSNDENEVVSEVSTADRKKNRLSQKRFSSSRNSSKSDLERKDSSSSVNEKDKDKDKGKRKSLSLSKETLTDSLETMLSEMSDSLVGSVKKHTSSNRKSSSRTPLEFELKSDFPLLKPSDTSKLKELMGDVKHAYYFHDGAVWAWNNGAIHLTTISTKTNPEHADLLVKLFPKEYDKLIYISASELKKIDGLDTRKRCGLRCKENLLLISFNNGSFDYESVDSKENLIYGTIQNTDIHFEFSEKTSFEDEKIALEDFKKKVEANEQMRSAIRRLKTKNRISELTSLADPGSSSSNTDRTSSNSSHTNTNEEKAKDDVKSLDLDIPLHTARTLSDVSATSRDTVEPAQIAPDVAQQIESEKPISEEDAKRLANSLRKAHDNQDYSTIAVKGNSNVLQQLKQQQRKSQPQSEDKTTSLVSSVTMMLNLFNNAEKAESKEPESSFLMGDSDYVSLSPTTTPMGSPRKEDNKAEVIASNNSSLGFVVLNQPQSDIPMIEGSGSGEDNMHVENPDDGKVETKALLVEEPLAGLNKEQKQIVQYFDLFCTRYEMKNTESRNDKNAVSLSCLGLLSRPKYGDNGIAAMKNFRQKFIDNINEINPEMNIKQYLIKLVLDNKGPFGILNNTYGPKSFNTHLVCYIWTDPDDKNMQENYNVDKVNGFMNGFLDDISQPDVDIEETIKQYFEAAFTNNRTEIKNAV